MPPWLDSAEEVGIMVGGAIAILTALAVAILTALAAVIAAWRAKIKPLLTTTQEAASTAADQLTPNHGSSIRDAVGRIESKVIELHADMRLDRAQVGRRLERLESYHSGPAAGSPPQENTQP